MKLVIETWQDGRKVSGSVQPVPPGTAEIKVVMTVNGAVSDLSVTSTRDAAGEPTKEGRRG